MHKNFSLLKKACLALLLMALMTSQVQASDVGQEK